MEAKSWLGNVVRTYARHPGISLVSPDATASGAGSVGGVIINGEEFLKFEGDQNKFIQQHIELYMRYLKKDSRAGKNSFDPGRPTVQPSSLPLIMTLPLVVFPYSIVSTLTCSSTWSTTSTSVILQKVKRSNQPKNFNN